MAYATSLENFMRQELRNFDMCRPTINKKEMKNILVFFVTAKKEVSDHHDDDTILDEIYSHPDFFSRSLE